MVLDLVDKWLLIELGANCRLSYQKLARHFGLTVNGIKKRVEKLREMGVILGSLLVLNRGIVFGSPRHYWFMSQLWVDESRDDEQHFIEQAKFPELGLSYLKTTRNTILLSGRVYDLARYLELVKFIQHLEGVHKSETEVLRGLFVPGLLRNARQIPQLTIKRTCVEHDFTKDQLLLLHYLKDDPRMQVTELAAKTKFSPKRVRKILNIFHQTRCVVFTIVRNLSAAKHTGALVRITIDETQTTPEDFARWIVEAYPFEFRMIFAVVDKPNQLWLSISAPHIQTIDAIAETIRSTPFTQHTDALVLFGAVFGDKTSPYYDRPLETLLKEAGL